MIDDVDKLELSLFSLFVAHTLPLSSNHLLPPIVDSSRGMKWGGATCPFILKLLNAKLIYSTFSCSFSHNIVALQGCLLCILSAMHTISLHVTKSRNKVYFLQV